MKNLYEKYLSLSERTIGILKEDKRKKGKKNLFKQIVNEDFPILWKNLDPKIQREHKIPHCFNPKRPSPRQMY